MDERASFGAWLRQRRRDLRLTQEDLAERMACSGAMVRKIEAGERAASQQMADLLAESFDIVAGERSAFLQFAQGRLNTNEVERTLWQTLHTVQAHPTNLPAPLTTLIGREQELEKLHELLLLDSTRLLTLTGPPGIGKTRLSLEAGIEVLDHFADGVYFVSLAPVIDPDLVPAAIVEGLGIPEKGTGSLLSDLRQSLSGKRILLLLDNFEQVLDASHIVLGLLGACPYLKVLVTSREALHVHGEQQFPVPVLATTDPENLPPIEAMGGVPAVALFIDRARAADPAFGLSEENARAVAAICKRLDGLPLAIELAAARIRLLSPQEMLARLESRLSILTGGPRNLPARQRTLRAAIDWSYSLLSDREQTLFARMGVFVDGCTLSAVEAVCNASGDLRPHVQDGVLSLLDKNLLKREQGADGESRFTMLETLREYAVECLEQRGETGALGRLHAEYYLALAEAAEPELRGPDQVSWLTRIEHELDNMRAALRWSLGELQGIDSGAAEDLEIGLRLASALSWFWHRRGYYSDGRKWLERGLAKAGCGIEDPESVCRIPLAMRAKALYSLGMLGWFQGAGHAEMRIPLRKSADIYRQIGDIQGLARSLRFLAACFLDDPETARTLTEESVSLGREVLASRGEERDAIWDLAEALFSNGRSAFTRKDYAAAASNCTESVRLFRKIGDRWRTAAPILILGRVAYVKGELGAARGHFEESLALLQEAGDKFYAALLLDALALVAQAEGDYEEAERLTEESLPIWREIGNTSRQAEALRVSGISAYHQADNEKALAALKESIHLIGAPGSHDGLEVASTITYLAGIAERQGQLPRAARLAGAGAVLLEPFRQEIAVATYIDFENQQMAAATQGDLDTIVCAIRTQLDEEVFARAWAGGQAMTIEWAIGYALRDPAIRAE